MVTRPHKSLLAVFGRYHAKLAAAEYLAQYVLGDYLLSHPRRSPTHPAAALRAGRIGDGEPRS
jgi:hypothetical protein